MRQTMKIDDISKNTILLTVYRNTSLKPFIIDTYRAVLDKIKFDHRHYEADNEDTEDNKDEQTIDNSSQEISFPWISVADDEESGWD